MPVYINTYIILIPHEYCNEHCKLMSRESASSPLLRRGGPGGAVPPPHAENKIEIVPHQTKICSCLF